MALDRRAFVLRKRAEHAVDGLYFPSLSARTLVYKGMLTSEQLRQFFPDLRDPRFESGLALVHSRFSTNTFPSWPLAHPYRYMAHNGEINTLAGNRNWMRAREALLATSLIEGDLSRIYPVCTPGASDSASFDEVLELLHLGGRSLPHAVLMMIPEAWENHTTMGHERRAFYRYHASLMEPWDGPAAVTFTDGTVVGAVLDRNGLRPARYWVTDDGLVVMASEVGVLDIAPERVVRKGRLQPGRMFLVDTAQGRLVDDDEIKAELAARAPLRRLAGAGPDPAGRAARPHHAHAPARRRGGRAAHLRLHHRGAADHSGSHGPGQRRADRFDGLGQRHRRAVGPVAAALRLLHPVVRPGDQPAAGCHPRGTGHVIGGHGGAGEQPAGCPAGILPADPAAAAGHRPRRLGQAHVRQRARRDAGVQGLRHRRPVRRDGGWRRRARQRRPVGRRWPGRSRTCGRRSRRRLPRAPTSLCCRTGTPPRPWRPSLRCC